MLEKSGIMVNGNIEEAVAIEKFGQFTGPGAAEANVKQCKGAGGADPCEIAQKFLECIHKGKKN